MQTQRRMGGVYDQARRGPVDLLPGMKRGLTTLHRRGNDVIAARPLFPITMAFENR